jgi:hypothetical protein
MADLKVRMGIRYESRYAVFAARLARKQEKVLRQSGAYAMKVIRNSIIEKKKAKANKKRSTSRPGLPPISHKSGHGGLRYVLFDADMTRQSVMAGVARTPAKNSWVMGSGGNAVRYTVRSSKRAPKLLNESGPATITKQWLRSGMTKILNVFYRQYPITAYPPTFQKIVELFGKKVATIRL